jgi:membrane protein implicated in regulation of membrane protease activity
MGQSLRDGRYVVLGTLGQGSQGHTFDGVDKREGQPVAIKRFDVRGAASWKDVDLAEREARVLQSLSHPKLPRYVDRFEEDGALYLVMEKIEGESLAAVRKRGETLGEKDVTRLLRDASEVLDYLHARSPPVIHRDLKPGNVLRRPDGSFAFVDFGAVRDKLKPEGGSTVVGTFGYMAPEQFQGRALPGSDVYALGATVLTMLTGREPEELPHKGLAIDVRAALRGRASSTLVATLEKMLEPDPDRRASRIAPLLGKGAGDRPRAEARAGRHEPHDHAPSDRFARRQARRAARRAERAARRQRRRYGGPPFPFSVIVTLVFLVAMLAVSIATQVVVPIVLTILSIFFARRAFRSAVDTVRDAGHRAVDAMDRVRRGSAGAEEAGPHVRVEGDEASPRARVGDAHDAEGAEDDDDAEDAGRRGER